MKYTRIHRLLRIVSLLQSGIPQRAPDLASACETTERTIFRDLKEIEKAGIPVSFDRRKKGYSIAGDFYMPPVELTLDEALALAALGQQLGGEDEQIPFLGPAWRAIAKVTSQLPRSVRDEVSDRARAIAIRTSPARPADDHASVYDAMQRAIAEGCVLSCAYEAVGGADRGSEKAFHFRPYALFFGVRAWYALGERSDRDGLRCLKLARFTSVRPTRATFEVPKRFSVDGYLGNAWRMIRGDRDHRVELEFDAAFAPSIAETIWHRTMEIDERRDGSCLVRFTVSGLDEIQWWVLSMGPHCRVVAPQELADRVQRLAEETASLYAAPAPKRRLPAGRRAEPAEPAERAAADRPRPRRTSASKQGRAR